MKHNAPLRRRLMDYPMIHLLPGRKEISLQVTTQQIKVRMAIVGIARLTGSNGSVTLPWMIAGAICDKKNMWTRYMPKVSLEIPVMMRGALGCSMQVKSRNAPKVAKRTLGVQNSHDHSRSGVSITCPGIPFHQNDHAVNVAPIKNVIAPMVRRFFRVQWRWTRM